MPFNQDERICECRFVDSNDNIWTRFVGKPRNRSIVVQIHSIGGIGKTEIEPLFDRSIGKHLTFRSKEDIGELAKSIRKRINEQKGVTGDSELDFLKPSAQTEETIDELTFRILKDIYTTKQAEEDKAHRRAAARENNRKILELIAKKQDQELESKSIEELEKMLQNDDD